jgi:hypothetical protein
MVFYYLLFTPQGLFTIIRHLRSSIAGLTTNDSRLTTTYTYI